MNLHSLAEEAPATVLGLFAQTRFHGYLDLFPCELSNVHHTVCAKLGHQPKQGLV